MIGWDIESEIDDKTFRVEVKFDKMAARTGNLVIEYFNTKSCTPSGISATTADLWVFVFSGTDGVWMASTAHLKKFVSEIKPHREISSGGDDNAALKLYRKDVILPSIFVRLDSLSPPCFLSSLRGLLAGAIQKEMPGYDGPREQERSL